ncbi:MAG: glycosyltransferase family 4 protein [Solirubrobacteraceae bacterium]|jgi:glycosyltransferase involved in cell wall biosynthesis
MSTKAAGLRIGMISYYLPSGSKIGVGYQAHALANALVDRGHSVTVFSGCGATEGARYETHTIPLSGANRTFKFAWYLRRVDWNAFDVIHAHGDNYWLWGRRLPPRIRTMHGSCFSEARFVRGARNRLRMLLLGCSEILATLAADMTVAVSNNTRQWMPWIRRVVPNGVAITAMPSVARSPLPSILFVGTYLNRKRGKLLVESFERDVLPRQPAAELWMVSTDAPAAQSVKVLGRVSDEQLAELYASAWVFCLPSSYEGFGIPYAEAMAAGCPVVATPNPGAVEVTDHGRYGLLVEPAALGEALADLLGDGEERARLARAGRERARRYDLAEIAATYEHLYVALIRR